MDKQETYSHGGVQFGTVHTSAPLNAYASTYGDHDVRGGVGGGGNFRFGNETDRINNINNNSAGSYTSENDSPFPNLSMIDEEHSTSENSTSDDSDSDDSDDSDDGLFGMLSNMLLYITFVLNG